MKKKFLLMVALSIGLIASATAQEKQLEELNALFLETDFMKEFQQLKEKATAIVLEVSANENNAYSEADTKRLQKEYAIIRNQATTMLLQIRNDHLNGKKSKYLIKHLNLYGKSLELYIMKFNRDYHKNFLQAYSEVSRKNFFECSPFPSPRTILPLLSNYSPILEKPYKLLKAYFRSEFIRYFEWPTWNELTAKSM